MSSSAGFHVGHFSHCSEQLLCSKQDSVNNPLRAWRDYSTGGYFQNLVHVGERGARTAASLNIPIVRSRKISPGVGNLKKDSFCVCFRAESSCVMTEVLGRETVPAYKSVAQLLDSFKEPEGARMEASRPSKLRPIR